MSKPAIVLWLLATTTLTGILITVLLLIPSLQGQLRPWILAAAAGSAVLSAPFSVKVARALA